MNGSQPERRPFGSTTIEVQDDEFFNGYQVGHFLYRTTQREKTSLTDTTIFTVLRDILQSVSHADRYRAGTISGWYAALYGYPLPKPAPVSNPPALAPEGNAGQERG
jgi:hypothetical protein